MRFVPVAIVSLLVASSAQAAAPIAGRWYTDQKDSIMEVGPCGPAMCGRVAQILKPRPDGKPAVDSNNPDPALRGKPILGLVVFKGFRDGGEEWTGGTLYDPRAGKAYKGTLTRMKNGTLRIKGCIGPFCQSKYFTPAP